MSTRYPGTAADRRKIAGRVAKGLKFWGGTDSLAGTLLVGVVAGLIGCIFGKKSEGALSNTCVWLYKTATEPNIYLTYAVIGLACALVATHKKVVNQRWFRRLVALPLLRMFGDAFILAFGAFLVATAFTGVRGDFTVGHGTDSTYIGHQEVQLAAGYFFALALFTTLCRFITDSLLDHAIYDPVNTHELGLERLLFYAGLGGCIAFAAVSLLFLH